MRLVLTGLAILGSAAVLAGCGKSGGSEEPVMPSAAPAVGITGSSLPPLLPQPASIAADPIARTVNTRRMLVPRLSASAALARRLASAPEVSMPAVVISSPSDRGADLD